MKIGPLELRLTQLKDGTWEYEISNANTGEVETRGYRPHENAARSAGLEDALLIRAYR